MTSLAEMKQREADSLKQEAEILESQICSDCSGEGEIFAAERVTPLTVDLPYKTCPTCQGTGIKQ